MGNPARAEAYLDMHRKLLHHIDLQINLPKRLEISGCLWENPHNDNYYCR